VLTQRFEREAVARSLSDPEATGAVAELQRDGSTDAVPGLATQPIVMVVDDSLTVRKVTQRLLTRSGYQAVLARDGVDALRQLQEITPAAMLVDIAMPHMDGFD
ncbi:response regulator, partial [Bacillus cereus]|nr:response regulator [Bacillus cereus]